ncbi:hypothetical protein BRD03_02350 [Halobacteriales archaeon QS_9_68_17]|nr:MAG: hypothetical protein BRD03_02350 [Halobacteriales archaeon QS_9_68_17]
MTPSLPSSGADWRLVARTVRLVLGKPAYALVAALAAVVGLTLFVYSLNARLINDLVLGGSLPPSNRLSILLNLYPVVSPTAYTGAESAVLVAVAAFTGVNVALVAYHLLENATLRGGSGSAAGVVLGTLGAGCAACGSTLLAGVLSLFGATGLFALLPLHGLEFALLSLVVLVLSLYWLADGMRGGRIRGCPVDP